MSIVAKLDGIEQALDSVHKGVKDHLENLPQYPDGISLLSCKAQVLASYIHHLLAFVSLRLEETKGTAVDPSLDEDLRLDISRLRVLLERGIKPLETKLKYQIEKVVRAANRPNVPVEDQDDIDADPLAFRPNPANLIPVASSSKSKDRQADDGIYRPPKIAPVAYVEEKRKRRSPPPSRIMVDMAQSLSSEPVVESSTGLHMPTAVVRNKLPKSRSMQSALVGASSDARQRYEEDNFMRVSMSKKDAKRNRTAERNRRFGDDDVLAGLGSDRWESGKKQKLGVLEKRQRRQDAADDGDMEGFGTRGAFAKAEKSMRKRQAKRRKV